MLNYTRHTRIFRRDARRSHPIAALRLVAIGQGLAIPPRRALLSGTISTPRLPKYSRATSIFHIWMGISSDPIKTQAMQVPFLKDLLRRDWILVRNNIKVDDLVPVKLRSDAPAAGDP